MQLIQSMQAVEIVDNSLKLIERTLPIPADFQVLIKVEAAGVNQPDIMQRKGLYPAPSDASDIPGLEVAGTIVALGTAVSNVDVLTK